MQQTNNTDAREPIYAVARTDGAFDISSPVNSSELLTMSLEQGRPIQLLRSWDEMTGQPSPRHSATADQTPMVELDGPSPIASAIPPLAPQAEQRKVGRPRGKSAVQKAADALAAAAGKGANSRQSATAL